MRPLVYEKPDWMTVYGDLKSTVFKTSILVVYDDLQLVGVISSE